MTPTDLVALVARLRATVPQYYGAWPIIQSLQEEAAAAIEQLQAELLEYQQCLDAGIEHRMRRKAETEAESLRAELAAVKEDSEKKLTHLQAEFDCAIEIAGRHKADRERLDELERNWGEWCIDTSASDPSIFMLCGNENHRPQFSNLRAAIDAARAQAGGK